MTANGASAAPALWAGTAPGTALPSHVIPISFILCESLKFSIQI